MFPLIRLPRSVQLSLEASSNALLQPQEGQGRRVDFGRPLGEPALAAADSVSWRIFKNPIALLTGGIAAVILELAEPAVRTGVWEHSAFLKDPMGRLRRTGLAAMVTVYGARSIAEPMIGGIVRMHSRVTGLTPDGEPFSATDPRLLTWVHATATFGFGQAYSRYVAALSPAEFDALYSEGLPASQLYGALDAPRSQAELNALFDSMRGRLEASDIVHEFLRVMREAPAFPAALRWMQPLVVRAAVELLPDWIRIRLGLTKAYGLNRAQKLLVKLAGTIADKIVLPDSPPMHSCRRLGLPKNYLYG